MDAAEIGDKFFGEYRPGYEIAVFALVDAIEAAAASQRDSSLALGMTQ